MRTFTLAQLRTKVQQRADIEGSRHFTPAELTDYLNTSYAELYETLAQSGRNYFESTQAITTVGLTPGTISLPSDFYMTLRVDWIASATRRVRLREVQIAELERWAATGSVARGYRVVGSALLLYPTPPTGQSYQHIYVPACPILVSDSDTVDGVAGWEELLVVDAAIKVGLKEETDVSILLNERNELRARIAVAAEDRQLLSTSRVTESSEDRELDEGSFANDARWWA